MRIEILRLRAVTIDAQIFENSTYSNRRGFFGFLFGFGSLVIFLLVGWLWDFGISLGLGVRVRFALGRDDIQIRRNVYVMVL